MNEFFSKLTGDDGKKKNSGGPQFRNPFANVGGGKGQGRGGKNYRGGGQALGGTTPGRIISISLSVPGSLGVKVEKRPNSEGTAIVSAVLPDTQAERAGLQRGDIICEPNTNGSKEIMYKRFLEMAASDVRPLLFDVRRIESRPIPGASSTAGATKPSTADAYAKRQAVIAAAEARDRAHKAKSKPISKKGGEKGTALLSAAEKRRLEEQREELARKHEESGPMSEEAKRAVAAAKAGEAAHAAELGYNPYETNKMTGGQAKTATAAVTHGAVDASKLVDDGGVPSQLPSPGATESPSDPVGSSDKEQLGPIDPQFEEAFMVVTFNNTDNEVAMQSIATMRKLIVNATTKGQIGQDETSAKFRRVRLSNPKIRSAITDVQGALELMLSVGFVLSENDDDGETYLVFPPGESGPDWLSKALERMEKYAE